MADDNNTEVTSGEGDNQPDPNAEAAKSAEALKAKRKDFLARQSIKAQQEAGQRGNGNADSNEGGTTDDLDLSALDATTAAKVRAALSDRTKVRGVVSEALKYGLEGSRKAKAYEIASELGIEKDEVPDLIASLSSARTPEELELRAKELVLDFRSDGTLVAPVVKAADSKKEGDTPTESRQFDVGRGGGANRTSALLDKIDKIDITKPGAIEEIDALKAEVDASQARANARRGNTR